MILPLQRQRDVLPRKSTGSATAAGRGDPGRQAIEKGEYGRALLSGVTDPSTPQLSRRQHDIAVLAAEGLASREIAERLSISVRTVDNHLGRIYAKLGVADRAELARAFTSRRREAGHP